MGVPEGCSITIASRRVPMASRHYIHTIFTCPPTAIPPTIIPLTTSGARAGLLRVRVSVGGFARALAIGEKKNFLE